MSGKNIIVLDQSTTNCGYSIYNINQDTDTYELLEMGSFNFEKVVNKGLLFIRLEEEIILLKEKYNIEALYLEEIPYDNNFGTGAVLGALKYFLTYIAKKMNLVYDYVAVSSWRAKFFKYTGVIKSKVKGEAKEQVHKWMINNVYGDYYKLELLTARSRIPQENITNDVSDSIGMGFYVCREKYGVTKFKNSAKLVLLKITIEGDDIKVKKPRKKKKVSKKEVA